MMRYERYVGWFVSARNKAGGVILKRIMNLVLVLQPGTSKEYVQFTRFLNLKLEKAPNIKHLDGYLSDLVECKRLDRFALK
jgi:hypothetical protein